MEHLDGTSQLWVALGDNLGGIGGRGSGNILWSEDGTTWTQSDSTGAAFALYGYGAAYGTSNGTSPLWVAVGNNNVSGNSNILWSNDGKTWTQSDSSGASFAWDG